MDKRVVVGGNMGIFSNELTISSEKPFEKDVLNRIKEVEKLTTLFEATDNQMVLAINSPWGTGKTTFLKMWNEYLKLEGYSTAYFNCWENDFVEEPFIAFIEEIRRGLGSKLIDNDFIKKSKDIVGILVRKLPSMGKAIIKNKTDIDLDNLISDEEMNELISRKFEDYKKSKDSVEGFRAELKKKASINFEETKKALVIFIDEIDRCRPDFAILLLERIKHFFNTENIIFILGIDKAALSNSIRVVYGEDTEIQGYISRFIDLEYTLDESGKNNILENLLVKYKLEEVFKKRTVSTAYEDNYIEFKRIFMGVIELLNLSFRDIEKILVKIILILKNSYKKYVFIYPFVLLVALRYVDVELYIKIKNAEVTVGEIKDEIKKLHNSSGIINDEHVEGIMSAMMAFLLDDEEYVNKIYQEKEEDNNNKKCKLYEWVTSTVKNHFEFYDIDFSIKRICSIVEMYDGIS